MTLADDPRLHSPLSDDETIGERAPAEDVLPESEREHDPERAEYVRALVDSPAHPLTGEEKEAARDDPGIGERVYAPASERVPKKAVLGQDELVDDIDPNTPERRAAGWREPAPAPARPAATRFDDSYSWNDSAPSRDWKVPVAVLGTAVLVGAIGGWLYYLRWKRERNRPINRLRRQAREVVQAVGDRLPSRDEIVETLPSAEQARPAGGAGLLAIALAFLASRILQRRSRQEAMAEDARDRLSEQSEKLANRLLASVDRARSLAAETTSSTRDRVDDASSDGRFRLPTFRR